MIGEKFLAHNLVKTLAHPVDIRRISTGGIYNFLAQDRLDKTSPLEEVYSALISKIVEGEHLCS